MGRAVRGGKKAPAASGRGRGGRGGRGGGRGGRGRNNAYVSSKTMTMDDDASSLDTPTGSPAPPSPPKPAAFQYYSRGPGPNLSDNSDDDEPSKDDNDDSCHMLPPTPAVHKTASGDEQDSDSGRSHNSNTGSNRGSRGVHPGHDSESDSIASSAGQRRKRKVSRSPERRRGKRPNNGRSPPRSTSYTRRSRTPNRRSSVSANRHYSSSSSCSSSSSRTSSSSCTSANSMAGLPPPTPAIQDYLRYDPPATPSPSGSVERPYSPFPDVIDRDVMSPSPAMFLQPPPTPCMAPRALSPIQIPPTPGCPRPNKRREKTVSPQPDSYNKLVKYDNPRTPRVNKQEYKREERKLASQELSTSTNVARRDSLIMPGSIKSVKMVNIMSHASFEQEWSPSFNFIIGENGSGKSAILSAIVAGLGGKAFDTGRANSMRAIIRNGQTKARIEIVLNNYPSKQYGEDIKIVRTFSREGSSRYQIRDSNQGMRSLTRHELNLVLSKLNIQVDNPLAILHQEMSRNFLRTKDPTVMYSYFYRALLLGSCESLLKKAHASIIQATQCLDAKDAMLKDLQNEVDKLKKEVELIESLKSVKETLKRLQNEYHWAVVKELEESNDQAKGEYEQALHRLDSATEEKNNTLQRVKEEESNLGSYETVWQGLQNALTKATGEHELRRKEKHELTMQGRNATGALIQINNVLENQYKHLAAIERKVSEHNSTVQDTYERQKREQEERKHALKTALEQAHNEDHDLGLKYAAKQHDCEVATRTEHQHEQQIRELRKRLDEKKNEQRDCMKVKKSKYDVFGKQMVTLMDRIKQTRWIKQPRGPLGACFTVKEEKWAPLIEYVLGGELNSFVADNNDDKTVLLKLIADVFPKGNQRGIRKPNVTLLRYGDRRVDVRGGIARCDKHPTILDQIDVIDEDYVVYNWLIEVARVERILLFDTYAEGCDLMKSKQKAPKSTQKGYSLDGYLFFPDPNYKTLTQNHYRGNLRFLQVTQQEKESLVDQIQGEINVINLELQRTNSKYENLKLRNQTVKAELKQIGDEYRGYKIRISQIRSEMDQLALSVCNAPDIDSWMDEIAEIKQTISAKKSEKEVYENQIIEMQDKMKEVTMLERASAAKMAELQGEQTKLYEQKQGAKQRIDELKRELGKKEGLCTNLQRAVADLHKKYKESEKQLQAKRAEAIKKSPCITKLSGTSREIQVKQQALRDELAKNEKKVGKKDQIDREYKKAKKANDQVRDEIHIMRCLLGLLRPAINLHQITFCNKTKEYGIAVRTSFKRLIKNRGYQGDLMVSPDEKTLVCYVSMDSSGNDRAQRNIEVKNGQQTMASKKGIMEYAGGMSGGERSFTTICFLTACWELMDMPFYVLDEFDVFMDHFNRKVSQNILMNVTRHKPYAQFFIFTPLAMALVPPKKSLILRLSAPNRNMDNSVNDEEEEVGPRVRRTILD